MTMTDSGLITAECQSAQAEDREISDACARMIASQYQENGPSGDFASSGAICDPSDVWRDCFYLRGASMYPGMAPAEKLAADMLGTYLGQAGRRGPVTGW